MKQLELLQKESLNLEAELLRQQNDKRKEEATKLFSSENLILKEKEKQPKTQTPSTSKNSSRLAYKLTKSKFIMNQDCIFSDRKCSQPQNQIYNSTNYPSFIQNMNKNKNKNINKMNKDISPRVKAMNKTHYIGNQISIPKRKKHSFMNVSSIN